MIDFGDNVVVNRGDSEEVTCTWGDFIDANDESILTREFFDIVSILTAGAVYAGGTGQGWYTIERAK